MRNVSPLKNHLLNGNIEDKKMLTKVKMRKLLNECCCDYQDLSDTGKVEILKDILILLMTLVFGDQPTRIEMSQGFTDKE